MTTSSEAATSSEVAAHQDTHQLSRSERIFVRISIWQTILSLVGVFIGVVALYAALTESEAVRKQTSAAVWPYVQLSVNDYATDESGLFEVILSNAGVGPADIRTMRVTFGGHPRTSWRDVVLSTNNGAPVEFRQTVASNRVLRPGEQVSIFGTNDLGVVTALRSAVANRSSAIEYCYCSIFDECWVADSRQPNVRPEPAAQCPDYGETVFQN